MNEPKVLELPDVSEYLVPAVTCGRCGARPSDRVFPSTRALYRMYPPEWPIRTHRCKCGKRIVILAGHYADAVPE